MTTNALIDAVIESVECEGEKLCQSEQIGLGRVTISMRGLGQAARFRSRIQAGQICSPGTYKQEICAVRYMEANNVHLDES